MSDLPPELKQAIFDGLNAATELDLTGMGHAIDVITEYGDMGLFLACVSWSHAVRVAATCDHEQCRGDGAGELFAGMQVVNAVTGEVMEPEELPPIMAPQIWAVRFVTAHMNGDQETEWALYSSVDGEGLGQGVFHLLRMAGAMVAKACE